MLTSEEDVLSPAQQREKEAAAARAAARAAKTAKSVAKAQARFPRVASWSSLLPRVGPFSSLGSAAATSTTASQAPTEGSSAGRSSEAPPARAPPPELQSPTLAAASTEAPEAVPVSDDIDAWPGQLEDGGIDYRFLSRHLLAAEVEARHVSEGSVRRDYHDVKLLAADERLLLAQALWTKVDAFLESRGPRELGPNARAVKEAVGRSHARQRLGDLQRKVAICHEAFRDLGSLDGWTFAQKLLGVTTHYKLHREDGSITIRIQGELTGCSVFDQLAMLREADMFKVWMPFMVGSRIVKEVNKTELVFHSTLSVPWIATRDAVVHIFACDNTEKGLLLVCGESVPEPEAGKEEGDRPPDNDVGYDEGPGALWGRVPGLKVPPRHAAWNADRMIVRDFRAQLRIDSPMACHLDVVANIEPKVPLPQPVINFGTRKLAGMLLFYLQKHARRIAQDPLRNAHARRMRRCAFYKDFFIPRILAICLDKARPGWDLGAVPVFEAAGLEADDDDDEEEEEDEEDSDDDDGDGFKGGARALARDTRRVWAEERARFEAALREKRRQKRLQQQQRHQGGLLQHWSPVFGGGETGPIAEEEQDAASARAAGPDAASVLSPPARTPLMQALSSLTGGELVGGGDEGGPPDEEELEEAEEDAAELLALAASWSSGRGGNHTPTPRSHRSSWATWVVCALATVASTLFASLHRLLPLLTLGGGLPWLVHHHLTTAYTARLPLAHQVLILLTTAILRQLGVALAAPRSRALRRAACLLSFAFLMAGMLALLWAAFRPVLLTDPSRPMGLVLVPRRRRRPTPTPHRHATDTWALLQSAETLYLPLLLWLYGEGRRAWRRYLRRRRRLWEEWGYVAGGSVDMDGGGKPHVE